MAQKTRKATSDKLAAKKAAVLGTDRKDKKKSPLPLLVMLACAALVIGGGIFFLGQKGDTAPPVAKVFNEKAETGEVAYPVSLFQDGKCRFYEHKTGNGATIRYFILKSSDGVIRAAFDACDSCWPAGKGYYQDADDMVCRNCRLRFASVKVNEVKGGCNPAPLRREVRGDKVVIQVEDILAGKRYFDFGRSES